MMIIIKSVRYKFHKINGLLILFTVWQSYVMVLCVCSAKNDLLPEKKEKKEKEKEKQKYKKKKRKRNRSRRRRKRKKYIQKKKKM